MSGKRPCNCHDKLPAGSLPSVADMQAALALATGGALANRPMGTGAGDIPDPLVVAAGGPVNDSSDLAALLRLARGNPGLKITLSYGEE